MVETCFSAVAMFWLGQGTETPYGEDNERRQFCTGSCPERRFSPAKLLPAVTMVLAGRGEGRMPRPRHHRFGI